MNPIVRRAGPEDVPRMAAALADAFSGDRPMQWFVPSASRRVPLLERYFSAMLPLYMDAGEVWTSDDPAAAATWVAPGRLPLPLRDQGPALPALLAVFGRRPLRAVAGSLAIERGHPKEPHWYLDYIGVAGGGRSAGVGSALLHAVLERCDAEGVPAALNAGSPRSRGLYERHGFQTTAEVQLPFDGPSLWRMWREPRR